jgi:hypothetical protein
MRIAVQINAASPESDNHYRLFTLLAQQHPEWHISYISYKDTDTCRVESSNERFFLVKPRITGKLSRYLWYQFRLKKILKQENIAIFISSDTDCSMGSSCRQLITINSETVFQKRNLVARLQKASGIICTDAFLKNKLIEKFPFTKDKIIVLGLVAYSGTRALTFSQKEEVKAAYSEKHDYFLVQLHVATVEKITMILKAFSLFKKWQKSGMKIILVANENGWQQIDKVIVNYKFREDVIIAEEKQASVLSQAAYAAIFFPEHDVIDSRMMNLLASEVPLALTSNPRFVSFFDKSVSFFEENEISLSKIMIHLYKDENFRNEQITKAYRLAQTHTNEGNARILSDWIIASGKS